MKNKITLTPVTACAVLRSGEYTDNSTVALIEYGLRNLGTNAEYDIAMKLQQMRQLAFKLIVEAIEEGLPVQEDALKLIDVEEEVITKKRFNT